MDTAIALGTGGLTQDDKLLLVGMRWPEFQKMDLETGKFKEECKIKLVNPIIKPFEFVRGFYITFENGIIMQVMAYFEHPHGHRLWAPFSTGNIAMLLYAPFVDSDFYVDIKGQKVYLPMPIEEYVRDAYEAVGKYRRHSYFVMLTEEEAE